MSVQPNERIFCALDTQRVDDARRLATAVHSAVGGIKLGLEFFLANGPQGVRDIDSRRPLFLDLKLHDIPNTVDGAIKSVLDLAPHMLTLHAAGGRAMLERAVRATADDANDKVARTRLLGVTVLTSLGDDDLDAIGQHGPATDQVRRLAALSQASGLDGVICSPREVAVLRADCGADFLLVVPGIRPAWASTDDQKRTLTPGEAIAAGADHLVIGRPITQAPDPAAAAARIVEELQGAAA
jgi:orotidine-5'-phosphate decarboxylase